MNNNLLPLDDVLVNTRAARYAENAQTNELNAISNYIYQVIIFEEMIPSLAEIFENIALNSMNHYEILGKLIKKLGTNPAVHTRVQNTPLNYNFTTIQQANMIAKKAIEENIIDEEKASMDYRKLAENSSDSAVATIYRRLSNDKDEHAKMLKQILYS
jgi:rubrerythrin